MKVVQRKDKKRKKLVRKAMKNVSWIKSISPHQLSSACRLLVLWVPPQASSPFIYYWFFHANCPFWFAERVPTLLRRYHNFPTLTLSVSKNIFPSSLSPVSPETIPLCFLRILTWTLSRGEYQDNAHWFSSWYGPFFYFLYVQLSSWSRRGFADFFPWTCSCDKQKRLIALS